MALRCPYQHVSYATWRLQLIRTLCRTERELSAPRFPYDSARRKRDYGTSQALRKGRSSHAPEPEPPAHTPDRSIDSPIKRSQKLNPFSSEGIDRIQDALTEVKLLHKKAGRLHNRKERVQTSQTVLYESPVKRKLERSHLKSPRRRPMQEEKASLHDNIWARILATPIRACFSTGTRLPIALLSDWNVVKDPTSDTVYLMPTGLADLDGMEKKMAAAMRSEAWKLEADAQPAAKQHGTASGGSHRVDFAGRDSDMEYVKADKKANPILSYAKSRIFLYVNYLRHITNALGKTRPPTKSRPNPRTEFSAVGLLHPRNRAKFGLTAHYERNKVDVALKTGKIERTPPDSESFKLEDLQWQPEIGERLIRILQKRIVIALKETVRVLNESPRKQHERRVLPLTIPRTGSFSIIRRYGYREALYSQLKAQLGEKDAVHPKADSNQTGGSPDFDELVEGPGIRAAEKAQPPPPWLAGSILLHIGKSDIDQLLTSTSRPTGTSQFLPPLPRNPLIPPMIPVGGAYRLPVFSLHRLFTASKNTPEIPHEISPDLQELADIINTCPSFNLAWPPVMPNSPLYSPTTTTTTTEGDELQDPKDFLILIKSLPGGQRTLVDELWRLWRYIGGRAYGKEPAFDVTEFRRDSLLEDNPDPEVEVEEAEDGDRSVEHDAVERRAQRNGGSMSLPSSSIPPPPPRPQPPPRSPPSSTTSSSFGLTMSSEEFQSWLDAKYPTPHTPEPSLVDQDHLLPR